MTDGSPGPDDRPRAPGRGVRGPQGADWSRTGARVAGRAGSGSGSLGVPGVAAAVDGGAIGLAPDGVGDPGRADGDPEVVAVGEGGPGGALVRCAGGAIGEPDLAGPAGSAVGGCGVPGVERPGAVVLPGQPEVAGARAAGDLREVAVAAGVTSSGAVQDGP